MCDTLNEYDISEARTPTLIVFEPRSRDGVPRIVNGDISPTLNTAQGGGDNRACYDARGNGDGTICPTITGDHQNRITDYTAIVVHSNDEDIHGSTVLQVEEG